MVSVSDGLQNGKVAVGNLHLVVQQKLGLLIQKAVFGKHRFFDFGEQIRAALKKFEVFRDAAGNGVLLHRVAEGQALAGIHVDKRQGG